jgi:hypothetical protein
MNIFTNSNNKSSRGLVEVVMQFFDKGDIVFQDELEDCEWLSSWEEHVEDYPELPEPKPEDEVVHAMRISESTGNLRITKDLVGFRFIFMGNWNTLDYSCGVEYEHSEVGTETFEGMEEIFIKAANRKPNQNVARVITLWSYWSEKDYWGEFDCGCEYLGVVDLRKIQVEANDE